MFIDSAKIYVKAGDGGRGCNSFYRDKYSRKGIPDGGEGGRGADIVIRADRNLHTLLDFQYNRRFVGAHGEHGSGKNKKGKTRLPIIIRVPCGTEVIDTSSACLLRDLKCDQQEVVVARGGKGGCGNKHRSEATEGEKGEEREVLLDLKVIADVGVVGFPNAGKSTLISAITNAHPKIAAYPFTTKSPVLGVVEAGSPEAFVVADIPGLIEGASRGRGLGDKFLRHLERTNLLIHLIDMGAQEGRDPFIDYKTINTELKNYGRDIYRKPQVIVANKMDLEGAQSNLKNFQKRVHKRIYLISALKREGMDELINALKKRLNVRSDEVR